MRYPTWETYSALYAKYLSKRSVKELASLVNISDKRVADLCGGSSRLGPYALKKGAKVVVVVDQSKEMLSSLSKRDRLISFCGSIDCFLGCFSVEFGVEGFDIVFCRQAINYWFNRESVVLLANSIRAGGFFVFNTFNAKPSRKPTIKEYEFEGHQFVEVSQLGENDMVHHVQCRDGMSPHTTEFRWIAPEEFESLLGNFFELHVDEKGKTSIYLCRRK